MTQQETTARAPGGTMATDQVFQVETHGIDPIPDEDRHGSAKDLFWLWFGSNLTFTYVINGALAVAFGLSFWQATGVVVLGGLAFFAISAAGLSGVRTGTATLVISRAPFGARGNWPAGMLNWVVSIGYTILNTVVGTLALEAFLTDLGWASGRTGRALALLITLALTFVVALWGHATVQFAERWISYVLAVGFAVLLVFLLPGADTGGAAAHPGASGWSLAFVVMLAGPFSYVPMPADYTRYLPRTTSMRSLTWYGALGGFVSSVALGVAGVAAATQTDMTDAVAGTEKLLPGWFQPLFLALVLGGSVTNSIVTLYSSSLNLQVLGVPWSRSKAIVISAAVTAGGALCALFLTDFTSSLLSFLSLLIIVFAPWGGVFLADMLMRRCRYDAPALHAGPGGAYWYRSGYHPAGMTALLVGMVFAALTCDSELWTGPLVAPLGGADLTLLGSVVSGLVYWALARRTVVPHTDPS
ncbi:MULTISPECIES: cytosine permease [unclassified Streptomyces]|jgi:NCS1 family nucleobase:cation symporter-1|uniref:purine-cytosine permease family protein n=1 Tax=unclassified Streptomyces TaxID=2593676 RepID=UPI00081B7095|nr:MULTISPECIES: cytosine permease [unclassified Streptomyces]MEE1746203.1 cytosine permease [Streptomyces sp. JV184]MYQ87285.1 cytosine or purine or uracil or thiamine or allantoin permease [Streptomyces sp. SID4936]SCE44295.1 NCS1 nucleoside transporter family [Streptomyces sp. DvalAA-43]